MDRKRTVDNSITRSSFLAKNTGITGFSPHIGLYQSLKELLENGIDATTTSSSSSDALCTLKLSRTSSSGGFRITVSDTGDGIARDSISNVVTNIFCSTKGQSCQSSSSSSSSSFGRYGIGIKAAILYAQETGVITPLTVTTCQAIDDTVSSARYGIDRAKDAPLIVSLSYSSKDSACSHGTTVSLEVDNVNDQDSTSSFLFIQAYLERLVAFPMRKTALILELVNTKPKAPSRGTKRGLTGDTTSTDFSSLSSSIFQSIGGTAHTQSSFDIRDYLASHFNVPIECVSSSFDSKITTPDYSTSLITSSLSSSSSSLQVQVAIVLTPVIPSTPPTSTEAREQSLKTLVEDARAAGNESGVIHIVRYANSIPLLTTSAECALTLGATDSVQWGQRFGLSLTPLFSIEEITLDEGKKKKKKTTASTKNKASSSSSEGGGGGGGGEAVKILPRKLLDCMNQHPAARVSAAFSADTSKLDAEGAYSARSCITDAVTVPFGSLRIFINVTGSSLLFGDLKKTHILDDMTKSRTLRSSYLVAEAMHVALARLQGQLKQHVSIIQVADRIPTQLLESTRTANLRLLKNIYLPSIASNLIKILTQAGGVSSNMWKNIVLSTSAAASAVAPSTTTATEEAGSQQRYLLLPESLHGIGNSLLQADGLISSLIEFEYEGLQQALLTRITRTLDACILAQDEAIVSAEIAEEEERAQEQLLEAFACHSAAHAHSLAIRKHEDDPFQHFVTAFASSGIGGQQVKEKGNTEQEEQEEEEEEEVDNEEVSNASACADRAFETALLAIQTHQMRSGQIS